MSHILERRCGTVAEGAFAQPSRSYVALGGGTSVAPGTTGLEVV